jgi:phage protein D
MAGLIPKPTVKITYNGKDTGKDLTDNLISLDYTDNISDKADEISIVIEDTQGYWRNHLPDTGATITVSIGYDDDLTPLNSFEIDRYRITGNPSTVTLSGNASPIQKALRTRNSQSWDNKTLQTIIKAIATKHGLSTDLRFKDVPLDYTAQDNETDLAFIMRLCDESDLNLKLHNTTIVCVPMNELMKQKPVMTLEEKQLSAWDADISLIEAVASVERRHHDPKKKQVEKVLVVYGAQDSDGKAIQTATTKAAQTTKNVKREIARQTHTGATQSDLDKTNRDRKRISFSVFGHPLFKAGVVLAFKDLGKNVSACLVETARHSISDSGYTTDIDGWLL